MTTLCQWEYPKYALIRAEATDPSDAESWQCFYWVGPLHRGHNSVAPIAWTIGTPGMIFHSMRHNLENALLAAAFVLLIVFPANIFNQVLGEHYAAIVAFIRRWRRRLHLGGSPPIAAAVPLASANNDAAPSAVNENSPTVNTPDRVSWPVFGVILLVGSVFGALLNPAFGLNVSSMKGLIATFLAFGFGTALSWVTGRRFRQWHKYPTETYLRALPLGLAVEALSVFVSRVTHFEPGYLYGVVVGLAFVGSMEERHNAHFAALSSLATLSVGLIAWLLWIPVNHFAVESGTSAVVVVLDDVLGSVFVGSLVGTVFGLLPLRGLPGGTLKNWRRDVWAGVFFVAVFLLVEVELRPASSPRSPGSVPLITSIVLFFAFGGATLWLRWFLNRRTQLAAVTTPTNVATSSEHQPAD
jgi:hypothetical protein